MSGENWRSVINDEGTINWPFIDNEDKLRGDKTQFIYFIGVGRPNFIKFRESLFKDLDVNHFVFSFKVS